MKKCAERRLILQQRVIHLFRMITLYRGAEELTGEVVAGSYVTRMISRAAKYSRFPGNRGPCEKGYILRLEVAPGDYECEHERQDCDQGTLRFSAKVRAYALCDVPLNGPESPVRIKLDGSCVWRDGNRIEWCEM
jgi:hypothetical protein